MDIKKIQLAAEESFKEEKNKRAVQAIVRSLAQIEKSKVRVAEAEEAHVDLLKEIEDGTFFFNRD